MKVTLICILLSCLALTQALREDKPLHDTCSNCRAFAAVIKAIASAELSEDDIKAAADFVCSIITNKTLQELCKSTLATDLDKLLDLIKNDTPEQLCEVLNVCS